MPLFANMAIDDKSLEFNADSRENLVRVHTKQYFYNRNAHDFDEISYSLEHKKLL